jgi:hypothetical protein
VFDGERTSWGNRVAGDLAAVTFAEAANELVAEIAATPQRLRPAVDEIRLWHGASAALPTRDPDLVQQVPA